MLTRAEKTKSNTRPAAGAAGRNARRLPSIPIQAYRYGVSNTVQKQEVIQRVQPGWRNNWVDTALGKRLTDGINPHAGHVQILGALMENFRRLGGEFNYTKRPNSSFLDGQLHGDCGTLARAFADIATGYYEIPGMATGAWGPCWSDAGATPYGGRQPDCDGGESWIFEGHTWATYNGAVYDILFCTNNLSNHVNVAGDDIRGIKGSVFPDGCYCWLADGSLVYSDGMIWHKIPPGYANLVKIALKNSPTGLKRMLAYILKSGRNMVKRAIQWVIDKIERLRGNNPDDEWDVLTDLGKEKED